MAVKAVVMARPEPHLVKRTASLIANKLCVMNLSVI
jgi:hypothetical protein